MSDDVVLVTAFKQAKDGKGHILRLFEPTGHARKTTVTIPALDFTADVALSAFEIETLYLDPQAKMLIEADMMEGV